MSDRFLPDEDTVEMRQLAHNQSGFTLIELLTVITIIAIIATVAVPNLISSKIVSNETAAIATLRNLATAQAQVYNRGIIDADDDGTGEFAFFGELTGAVAPRNAGGGNILPPLLSASFSQVKAGQVSKQGYQFRIYLPDLGGIGLEESLANYGAVDSDQAENYWCCYAWPTDRRNGGRRVFFVNQLGEALWSDNTIQGYSGPGSVPAAGAAFPGAIPNDISVRYVPGTPAADGGTWSPVGQ